MERVFGDLCFVVVALLGESTLVETTAKLPSVLRARGGVYMIWLGLMLVRAKKQLKDSCLLTWGLLDRQP